MDETPDESDELQDETHHRVQHRRRREALRAGLDPVAARLFAESDIEVRDLRHLVALGCPQDLLPKILL